MYVKIIIDNDDNDKTNNYNNGDAQELLKCSQI
jgi:hypothetical protein